MNLDLTQLDEHELEALHGRIVARLNALRDLRMKQQMQTFQVGDRVAFQAPGHDLKHGTVVRCNRKTLTVVTDERHQWNVAPVFLSRVIDVATNVSTANSHVVQLFSKP